MTTLLSTEKLQVEPSNKRTWEHSYHTWQLARSTSNLPKTKLLRHHFKQKIKKKIIKRSSLITTLGKINYRTKTGETKSKGCHLNFKNIRFKSCKENKFSKLLQTLLQESSLLVGGYKIKKISNMKRLKLKSINNRFKTIKKCSAAQNLDIVIPSTGHLRGFRFV